VNVPAREQFPKLLRLKGRTGKSRPPGAVPLLGRLRGFLAAVALGAWQMLMRSPLPAPLDDPCLLHLVTLHGTAMAYVVTTFFAMGFRLCGGGDQLGVRSRRHRGVDRLRCLPGRP